LRDQAGEYEFVNLSGKLIRPCEACNGCVRNNRCILDDDFQEVMEKCYQAEAIVFGAPNYWDHVNAKGHAFWERVCFSGRHNSLFPLEGKMGVIATVASTGNSEPVVDDIETYFEDARMHTVKEISVQGEYACFRMVKAAVSVAKDSDIELNPRSVGVSQAVGKVLYPVYDATDKAGVGSSHPPVIEGEYHLPSKGWAEMIRKVYEVDPLRCSGCGGQMKIISFIEENKTIDRIIRHLELTFEAERLPPPHRQRFLMAAEGKGKYI